jgi:hypothetical protein
MVTWAFHKGADPSGKDANGIHDCDDAVDTIVDIDSDNEMKANKRADYYFAFFLCCEYRTPHWHADLVWPMLGPNLLSGSLSSRDCHVRVADPTMTQTFFGHFSCRQISEKIYVLHNDYDVNCYEGSQWWTLALVSTFGLVVVSIGFPVGMALWMRNTMSEELRKVRYEGKGRAVAYRDFRRKFSYISVSRL